MTFKLAPGSYTGVTLYFNKQPKIALFVVTLAYEAVLGNCIPVPSGKIIRQPGCQMTRHAGGHLSRERGVAAGNAGAGSTER
jgi:hypothetical protein